MSVFLERIENHIAPLVGDLGFSIVRLSFFNNKTLQVMIERTDDTPVGIDDCEKVSRALSVSLDVLDAIKNSYNLEISSAGINRPLVKVKDYVRFVGKHIVVKTHVSRSDQKIFKGILELATENGIRLYVDTQLGSVEFEYDEIKSANIDGFKSLEKDG